MYSLTHPFYAASGGEYNPKRYIKEQIKALQEEKARLLESEITKEEFLEHVKSKFKAERIKEQIKALQEEKARLLESEITKEEFLEHVKSKFKAERQSRIDMLSQYLLDKKERNILPFTDRVLDGMEDRQIHTVLFLALTEEDIEAAVSLLPDTGMPETERDAQIQEIDNKISELSQRLKDEQNFHSALRTNLKK